MAIDAVTPALPFPFDRMEEMNKEGVRRMQFGPLVTITVTDSYLPGHLHLSILEGSAVVASVPLTPAAAAHLAALLTMPVADKVWSDPVADPEAAILLMDAGISSLSDEVLEALSPEAKATLSALRGQSEKSPS